MSYSKNMKKHIAVAMSSILALGATFVQGAETQTKNAGESKTIKSFDDSMREIPIWRTWTARIHEGKKDDYVKYLREVYSRKLEAWKKEGLISGYLVILREEPIGKDQPDVLFMFQQPNMASLDVEGSRWDEASKKVMEKIKDPVLLKMDTEYSGWRDYTGWEPVGRQVIGSQ